MYIFLGSKNTWLGLENKDTWLGLGSKNNLLGLGNKHAWLSPDNKTTYYNNNTWLGFLGYFTHPFFPVYFLESLSCDSAKEWLVSSSDDPGTTSTRLIQIVVLNAL